MNQKRNTLKKVAGASAVAALAPSSWTKPIVNSVLLPVHAQTSDTPTTGEVVFIEKSIRCEVEVLAMFTTTSPAGFFVFDNNTNKPLELLDIDVTVTLGNGAVLAGGGSAVVTSPPYDEVVFPNFEFLPVTIEPGGRFSARGFVLADSDEEVRICKNLDFSVSLELTTDMGTIRVN